MNAADGEERGTVRNETEATGKEGEAREQERKDRSGIEKKKKKIMSPNAAAEAITRYTKCQGKKRPL